MKSLNVYFLTALAAALLAGCATSSPPNAAGSDGAETAPLLNNARALGRALDTAPTVGPEGVTFRIEAPEAVLVTIAGQFNGWDGKATALTKNEAGLWSVTLPLRPGKHRYKFLIDGAWLPDPANPAHEADGFGHYNSIVEVAR